jgi:mannose-6-phosphate isomerase-like protein (cupin superfamily)
MCPPLDPSGDDPGVLEHLEVLGNRGLRDRDARSRVADRRGAVRQPLDDRAPHGVREGEEAPVETGRIVHLKVNNIREPSATIENVSERTFAVVSLDELERYPAMTGAPVLLPLRRRLGIRAFGINCWTAPVGAPVIERHSEPDGDEEVYVILRGRVRFTVGDETFDAAPATLVHVRPNTLREGVAVEPETLVLAIGAKPGEAFEPKSWEDFQIAFAQARARGEGEARALLAEMLARDPDAWQPAYNAACFESLTGNIDAAFEQLARALALGPPRVRELAAEGEDFTALRSDPRWQQLME